MKKSIKLLLLAALAWPALAMSQAVVPAPSGTPEAWRLVSAWYTNVGTIDNPTFDPTTSFGRNTVNVVIEGNSMYIQGLCHAIPNAWVVGTISGSTVTFAKNQFYGNGVNGAHHYLVGEGVVETNSNGDPVTDSDGHIIIHEGTAVDVKMNYDATNKILTMSYDCQYILDCDRENGLLVESHQVGVDNTISSWGYHEGLEIYQPAVKQMKTLSKADLAGVTYTWPITNNDATNIAAGRVASVLDPVTVTDAESAAKAIALIHKIYMDQRFPGPYTRGYTAAGVPEGTVSYSAVGRIARSGNNYNYSNSYGWNIPNTTALNRYQNYNLYWFDPTDYRPTVEGYTTLLVEVQDDFTFDRNWYRNGEYVEKSTDPYQNLLIYFQNTIKRVTLLTEAKRTGNNLTSGTLYKIDADAINRFYLISKGQVRWYNNSYSNYSDGEPYYFNGYQDESCEILFYHMFEQFSPTLGTGVQASKKDIYNQLVNADPMGEQKTGFPVFHDCISVPYANLNNGTGAGGHEFQMSEENSSMTYDMRDLLFFVPDRRMTQHSGWTYVSPFNNQITNVGSRDSGSQEYFNYCNEYAPRMDMYVIHLYEIEGQQVEVGGVDQHVYQLNLNWASNMSNFLPGEQQVYYLYRKVTDANGATEFQPVYKSRVDENGNLIVSDEIVTIQGIYGKFTLDYIDYIEMDPTGKLVTYYVQGQDVDDKGNHFLELQSSNQQSYPVPGYDKSVRMSLKIDSDYYSKFVVNEEKNNYYNEVVVSNNYGTDVTANYLQEGQNPTVIYFQRFDNSINDGQGNEKEPVIVAKATVTSKDVANGRITVNMEYLNQANFTGAKKGTTNQPNTFTFTFDKGNQEGHIDFGTNAQGESTFRFYDNFQADVSHNEHPALYLYRAFFESAQYFRLEDGTDATSNKVYSNLKPVVIHKTDPSVGGAFTLDDVLQDNDMSLTLPESPTYSLTLEHASKSDFYGYQVCTWADANNVSIPTEFDANTAYGYANNQGEKYSLHFGNNPKFEEDQSGSTATFKDLELQKNGGAYVYAPQAVDLKENTYGAPRKVNAVGKLEVKAYQPTDNDEGDMAQMSEYKWYDNGNWYSYYNIYLNFTALDVPAGYELYKVRAWRQVTDKSILGEEVGSRAGRANYDGDWYMYEDMNFGDPLKISDGSATQPDVMSLSKLKGAGFNLGYRSNKIAKPVNPDGTGGGPVFEYDLTPNPNADNTAVENLIKSEMRATFGAKRLKTPDDDSGSLTELNAKFKVRAYFTKKTNPLTNASTIPEAEPIYVLGNSNMSDSWDPTQPLAGLYSENGTTYTGNVVINATNDESFGYFSFSTKKASTNDNNGWNEISGYRYGAANSDGAFWVNEENLGQDLALTKAAEPKAFRIAAGAYKLTVTKNNEGNLTNLVITKAVANAPRRAAMRGSDYDYYIAEGETDNISLEGSSIITGISGVKADVNREVVSVTYVNPLGQQSSRPFSGVNMVVTRYSDGSMSTTKVVK